MFRREKITALGIGILMGMLIVVVLPTFLIVILALVALAMIALGWQLRLRA